MKLPELKEKNWKAYTALIDFWAELSRISMIAAKRDIKEDLGFRYSLSEKSGKFTFEDYHTGDTFIYDEINNEWKFL